MSKNIAFYTLGCKLNFAETSSISKGFIERGYSIVDFKEVADVYVIHSCTVTSQADKKTRAAIRQAHRRNPEAVISVIGCSAQLHPDTIASIEGVNVVLGNEDKFNLLQYVEDPALRPVQFDSTTLQQATFYPSVSSDDRTRSFVKIQDGCDNFCAYCTIPFARGRSRSNTIEQTLDTCHTLSDNNIKEIVLTGVNIGDFGKANQEDLLGLLKRLDKELPGIERIRISSIEPDLLSDETIKFVAQSDKIQHHFHIPLQVGSDRLLKEMNRKYDTSLFSDRITLIKEVMPEACVAVDVIAGLPGETDEDFETTYHLIEQLPISYLHVFPYSERELTKAIKLAGKVPVHERNRRCKVLIDLSDKKKRDFYSSNIGHTEKVLWESDVINGFMLGFTGNYIRVKTPYNSSLVNQISTITLSTLVDDGIFIV